jgi:beta-lactamase class D
MKNSPVSVLYIGLLSLSLSLSFNTCFSQPSISIELPLKNNKVAVNTPANIDFSRHFQAFNIEGSILIYDQQKSQIFQYNPSRNRTSFPAASTFKIPNSLIALETGVIKDELALLTWDGIERTLPQWNRDLNLREAFKLSAVWFYQVLARRVGYEQMQKWITTMGYGNQNIGTKMDIDQFWLNGKLKITPAEQVTFLRHLHANKLPFSERTLTTIKDIMIVEKTPNYTIRAKTGWFGFGDRTVQNIRWYVGYVEKGEQVYFFAEVLNDN